MRVEYEIYPEFCTFMNRLGGRAKEPEVPGRSVRPGCLISVSPNAILVGCVSQKQPNPKPAKDLYSSPLFIRRRVYAERTGKPWFILSALHGLVDPDTILEPYDRTLKTMSAAKRLAWSRKVVEQLEGRFGSLQGFCFELHAGEDYARTLEAFLRSREASVVRPLRGLAIGKQLQWYDRTLAGAR